MYILRYFADINNYSLIWDDLGRKYEFLRCFFELILREKDEPVCNI